MYEYGDIGAVISNFIAIEIELWGIFDCKDIELWEEFRDDFKGFTEEEFRFVSNATIRNLRAVLRRHGVWVKKGTRTSIATALVNTLNEKTPTDWTEDEIIRCLHNGEEFSSNKIRCGAFGWPSNDMNLSKSESSSKRRKKLFASRRANQKIIDEFRKTKSSASPIGQPIQPPTGQQISPLIGQEFQPLTGQPNQPPTGQQISPPHTPSTKPESSVSLMFLASVAAPAAPQSKLQSTTLSMSQSATLSTPQSKPSSGHSSVASSMPQLVTSPMPQSATASMPQSATSFLPQPTASSQVLLSPGHSSATSSLNVRSPDEALSIKAPQHAITFSIKAFHHAAAFNVVFIISTTSSHLTAASLIIPSISIFISTSHLIFQRMGIG